MGSGSFEVVTTGTWSIVLVTAGPEELLETSSFLDDEGADSASDVFPDGRTVADG